MFHKVRRKMRFTVSSAIFVLSYTTSIFAKSIDIAKHRESTNLEDNFDNNIIDFDDEYSLKFNKKYDLPWHSNDKDSIKYTIDKKENENIRNLEKNRVDEIETKDKQSSVLETDTTTSTDIVMPFELISTSENYQASLWESTVEDDLTVIPLSTTIKTPTLEVNQTVTLPASTQSTEITEPITVTTETSQEATTTEIKNIETTTHRNETDYMTTEKVEDFKEINNTSEIITLDLPTTLLNVETTTIIVDIVTDTIGIENTTFIKARDLEGKRDNITKSENTDLSTEHLDVPIFIEPDSEDNTDVPEDYYDSKDVMPTPAPKTDALSVLFGFAGSVVESVVESVAERVVPKGIYDLFKRMQRQNEALEAERLRSREENGGLGQFGRGILKSISSGLSKPFIQIMDGVRDRGSLDSDRGFVSSLASGVTTVANVASSAVEQFKDRVQAIYPGTLWCGGGHSASARSGELGFFFLTDTCCRQHDACKIFIKAGDTKYGLTNTGLFTRSHCSCDIRFRECLHRTNSLVSSQIGLTYFNVLGPQCFRKAHPIVKCLRRTRITGQKCEEYELDYTKPKMWQWFDNEFF